MSSRHADLDQFSCKGKQLLVELKKIPECDSQPIKQDMDAIVDQWLDVSQSFCWTGSRSAEVMVQGIRRLALKRVVTSFI